MQVGGRWGAGGGNGNGTVQLLDPAWLAGVAKPTERDFGPCPVYSHFCWRKDLNHGNGVARKVPADTYYACEPPSQYTHTHARAAPAPACPDRHS